MLLRVLQGQGTGVFTPALGEVLDWGRDCVPCVAGEEQWFGVPGEVEAQAPSTVLQVHGLG